MHTKNRNDKHKIIKTIKEIKANTKIRGNENNVMI